MNPNILVVMGVAGAGKTTVGTELARRIGCRFYDADDLHPEANRRKMAAGLPLTDADRAPWLLAVRALIERCIRDSTPAVVACSALKQAYRDAIAASPSSIRFIFLDGPADLIARRLAARRGHFFEAALLQTQFDALEIPRDAIIVDISPSAAGIVATIIHRLGADSRK